MNDTNTPASKEPIAQNLSAEETAELEQQDISPDSLLGDFRGKPLGSMLIFTIVFHVAFISIFSLGYFSGLVLGQDTAEMSQEERIDEAVRDATSELDVIAARYGLQAQELIEQFSDGTRIPAAAVPDEMDTEIANETETETVTTPATSEENQELSAIEQELQVEIDGPAKPEFSIDDEDDMFAPDPQQ